MTPEALHQFLIDAGYSDNFAEQAAQYSSLYDGDIKRFVDMVEDAIERSSVEDSHNLMDRGAKITERDYTGDNLTTGGYDYENKSNRW